MEMCHKIYKMKFRYTTFSAKVDSCTDTVTLNGEQTSFPSIGYYPLFSPPCEAAPVKRTIRSRMLIEDKEGNPLDLGEFKFDVPPSLSLELLSMSYMSITVCHTFSDEEWNPTAEETAIEELCLIDL
jgi:hypothetical protein